MCNFIKPALADGGKTDWSIILGGCPDPAERYAVEELSRFLHEITGAVYPVLEDPESAAVCQIRIGYRLCVEQTDAVVDFAKLGSDGFVIITRDQRIMIAGNSPRGTLNGVYTFLENQLGCRWFAPGVSRIPPRNRIDIPILTEEHVPALEYREAYLYDGLDANWAARNRLNGQAYGLKDRHGQGIRYARFVHTFNEIASPDDWYDGHPEYFSLVDGKRLRRHTQLCLTNPAVLALAVQKVKQWLTEQPEATIVSVSQNDCYNPCTCDQCRAVDEYEGSHSGTLIRFVNAVAEAIADEYPQVFVDTLAYQYTRKAPLHVTPHPRVIVRLCSIECCFSHPLDVCRTVSWPFNQMAPPDTAFAEDLRDWSRICDRIYIWDYVTNFAHYLEPFPNLRVLAPNLRFFADHHVRGVFEQGNYQSGGGDFAPLKAYVLTKLLWNPRLDSEALMAEFAEGYYGQSADYILAYIRLLHDACEQSDTHLGIYDPPMHVYLTPELLNQAESIFDDAERAAENEVVLQRVKTARIPLQYVCLYRMAPDDPEYKTRAAAFLATLNASKITCVSEYLSVDQLRIFMEQGMTLPQIEAQRIAQFQADQALQA